MQRRTFLRHAAASVGVAAAPGRFAIAQPVRGKTLRVVPHANLTLLDPHFTTALVTTNHGWAIYDTLFGVDAKQQTRPQMAAGYVTEDDGRTCLITLRDGLKFHNGEPVLARDCAQSLIRWSAREALGQSAAKFIDSWGVKDDKTIRIALKRPLPALIPLMARVGATIPFIMPEHIARTDPFKQVTETIGSGPYKFVKDEFVAGSRAVYTRNADYVPRQEAAEWTSGGKVAHFDRIEWHVIPDVATAAAALQSGEVDWYEQVSADLVPLLRANANLRIGLANVSGYNGILRFNHIQPPFNNAAIRRAVMMAVDQSDYMAAVTAADPTAFKTCKALLPCGTPDGRELGAALMPGDLARGRSALQAAGYNNEKVVIISPSDFPTIGPFGDVTYDLLKKLGMNVELVQTDWGTVTQRRNNRESVDKGGWSIVHTWGSTSAIGNPISQFFLRGMGNAGWAGWFKDDLVEQLTEEWLLAASDQERGVIADRLQTHAFQAIPFVPLGQFQIRNAYHKSLQGMIEATGVYPWEIRRI
ncbi:MAG: ABC transporter substrate-binding protein [Acetobacteraceae bacterium]|nr:ABC transporter substrate-binding protein [Acetobacteraceae bacterium]